MRISALAKHINIFFPVTFERQLKNMRIVLIFVLGIHMAGAAKHTLQYFYTATSGIPNFPEFVSLGMVDGQQVDYYDSKIKRAIPKTEWMSASEGPEYWDRETQNCLGTEQVYINNIVTVKSRFNQSGGVHTVQNMYGCEWDDETKATAGFIQYGFDGEDFLSLDFKDLRWISPLQQGISTTNKWNDDRAYLESDRQYFGTQCIEWLKKYLEYGKSSFEKTVSPEVSLLQKDSSAPVACHATGFYPSAVKITWLKKGQELDEDVELGQLVPNEDGTFQRTSTLRVTPDEWKQNEYSCVAEHKGKTFKMILTQDKIRTNNGDSVPIGIIVGCAVAAVLLVGLAIVGFKVYQKKKETLFKPVNTSDGGSNSSSSQTGPV